MRFDLKLLLKHKAINGWYLFSLMSIPMSIVIARALVEADLSTGTGVSAMIGYSVRWAVPFIYLAFAASSVQILFPGAMSMWVIRNRKIIGLCFAVAMAWQGLFIFILSTFFRDYYFKDVYLLRDELEGSVGYIFLVAMVVTSFRFGRRRMTSVQWKLVHKSGMYFLWAYPFSVYWWSLSYEEGPSLLDYVFYWAGFSAFALRIAAWAKRRYQTSKRKLPSGSSPILLKVTGSVSVVLGIVLAVFSPNWQGAITEYFTASKWSADLVLWFPFWPFEPYLSLFLIGVGAMLVTEVRSNVGSSRYSIGMPG